MADQQLDPPPPELIELCTAAYDGDVDTVNLILDEHGHLMDGSLIDGLPGWDENENLPLRPLIAAEFGNQPAVIELLIERGLTINASAYDGSTALHLAAVHGNLLCMEILMASGAAVDIVVNYGGTPLCLACNHGKPDACRMLIAHNANVHLANEYGETPLHYASYHGCLEIVRMLLDAGADWRTINNDGRRPLQVNKERLPITISAAKHPRLQYCAALLVGAGDRDWSLVPTPCAGIEEALLSVWQHAPQDIHQVFQRSFPNLDASRQSTIRTALLAFNHLLPGPGLQLVRHSIIKELWFS